MEICDDRPSPPGDDPEPGPRAQAAHPRRLLRLRQVRSPTRSQGGRRDLRPDRDGGRPVARRPARSQGDPPAGRVGRARHRGSEPGAGEQQRREPSEWRCGWVPQGHRRRGCPDEGQNDGFLQGQVPVEAALCPHQPGRDDRADRWRSRRRGELWYWALQDARNAVQKAFDQMDTGARGDGAN